MEIVESWEYTPNSKTNFKCTLVNKGKWKIEQTTGKWICLIEPKATITAPTYHDQVNFITCLLEAERRNEAYIFKDGSSIPKFRRARIEGLISILVAHL